MTMDAFAREAWLKAWKRETYSSGCPMVILPREIKTLIISQLTLEALSRLGQSCRTWYQSTLPELYTRDAKEGNSFAIRWMASHAVDEQTTESALNTLTISARFGGQVDVVSEQDENRALYETPTALHHAIARRNLRLAKKLLDMGARHDIPCLKPRQLLLTSTSENFMAKLCHFVDVFEVLLTIGQWFPIFLAFIHGDPDMGQLLVDRGAGHEAITSPFFVSMPSRIPILHFAAADTTEHIDQWRFLFHRFRKHINERCTEKEETPLHVALRCGSIQSMQLALEAGAKMEVINASLRTPLLALVRELNTLRRQRWKIRDQNHIDCIMKIVEFGGSIHPGGDSVMVYVTGYYCRNPDMWPDMRHILNFFLDHGADLNERTLSGIDLVSHLIPVICNAPPPAMEALKELLHDLVDRGLDLTRLPLRGRSPLSTVIIKKDAQPAWLFDLLCKKGATIPDEEVDHSLIRWCVIPRLWVGNQHNIWQHAKQISQATAIDAYRRAISYDTSSLFDLLVRMPLIVPSLYAMVCMAFCYKKKWSWTKIVAREFEDNCSTWNSLGQESMLHGTVRFFEEVPGYSAADAIQDISKLMREGVDITMHDIAGRNPLDLLLHLACDKTDCSELIAFLEAELERAHNLQTPRVHVTQGARIESVSELVG